MEFKQFKKRMQEHVAEMIQDAEHLFEVDVDKDAFWNLYLDSFPAGTNNIYRERREHDCSCCRHFIRDIGNMVVIKGNHIQTIWDFDTGSTTYQPVANALDAYLKARVVTDRYFTQVAKIGTDSNKELMSDGTVHTWEHFYLELPAKFVDRSRRSEGDVKNEFRTAKQVFKRSLEEISMEAVDTVLELIAQNSLYKGEEWKRALTDFKKLKKEYAKIPDAEKDNYTWVKSSQVGATVGRIRNHSIGVLLTDITEGMDLDSAVKRYENIVAPANYKRPKAIFTKKMLEDAKKTITDLGYMESLSRRFATLDDITVNNILFSNKDSAKRISGADIFAEMAQDVAVNPKKFSGVKEMSADDFVKNVLPTATNVEVLLENKHVANMVSLIAPKNKEAKTMFKWNNGFSWAYSGNMTDSSLRENVKAAGGKIDGVLRFSIQWNDVEDDFNDLDAHCITPYSHIYYGAKYDHGTKGALDVDIINPKDGVPAVENIVWGSLRDMKPGDYRFYVHNFNNRGGRGGFRAEIEFDGVIRSYDYSREILGGHDVNVAVVHFDGQNFTIREMLPSNVSSRDVWGLKTQQFVPVSVICYSPNYWDEQNGIGHRHYFFMLKDCVNPERPNSMYNEFLKEELMQHKRVFEALGAKMAVEDSDDQLSGIGFSSTKRNDVVVRVRGSVERVVKIKF